MSSVNTSEEGNLTFSPNYDSSFTSPDLMKQPISSGQGNTETPPSNLDVSGIVKQMEDCFKALFNIFESQSLQGNNPYTQYRSFLRVNGFRMKKFDSLYTDSLHLLTLLTTKSSITDVRSLANTGLIPNDSDEISEGKRRLKKDLSEFFKNEGEILLESQVHFDISIEQKNEIGCLSSFEKTNYLTFTSAWTKMLATLALEIRNPEVELDRAMRLEDRAKRERASNPGQASEDAFKKATDQANEIASSTQYSNADVLREELVTYQKTYLKDMASQKDAAKVRSVRAKAAGAGVILSTGLLATTRYQTMRQLSKADAKDEKQTSDAAKAERIKNAFTVENDDENGAEQVDKVVTNFLKSEEQMTRLVKQDDGLKSYLKKQNIDLADLDKQCKETGAGCQEAMSNAVKESENWLSIHKTKIDPNSKEFSTINKELKDLRKSYRGLIEAQFRNAQGRPSEMESIVDRYTAYDVKQLQTVALDRLNSTKRSSTTTFLKDYATLQDELASDPVLRKKWTKKGGFIFSDAEREALQDVDSLVPEAKSRIKSVSKGLEENLSKQNGQEFDYLKGGKKFDPQTQLGDYRTHLVNQQKRTRFSISDDPQFVNAISEDSRLGFRNLVANGKSPGLTLSQAQDNIAKTAGETAQRERVEALDAVLGNVGTTIASHVELSPRRRNRSRIPRKKSRSSRKKSRNRNRVSQKKSRNRSKVSRKKSRNRSRVSRKKRSRVSRNRTISSGIWDSTKSDFKKVGHSIGKGFHKVTSEVAASKPGKAVLKSYSKANRPQVCKDCLKLRCGAPDPAITTLTIPKGWTKGTSINITLLSGRKIPVKPPDTMSVGQKLEVKIPPLPTTMLIPYKVWVEAQNKGRSFVDIPWHYGRIVSVPIPLNAPKGSELRYTPPEPTKDEWEKICLGKGGVCHTNCLQLSPACAKCLKKEHDEWMKDKIDPKTKQMKINPKTKKPWTCNKKNGCFQKLQSECANSLKTRVKGTAARNAAGEAVCPTDILQDFGDYTNIAQAPEMVGMAVGLVDWAVSGCLEGICEAALV